LEPAALRGEKKDGFGLRAAAGGRRLGEAQLVEDGLQRAEPGEAALEQVGADEGGGRPFALQEAEPVIDPAPVRGQVPAHRRCNRTPARVAGW